MANSYETGQLRRAQSGIPRGAMNEMVKTYLAVMAGGAIGTGLRMWLSALLAAKFGETFPIGTLAVNVIGSFIISFFAQLAGPDGPFLVSTLTRQVVMIGVLGGFTTFSSFSFQTLTLLHDGQWARASANITLSVALCLFAVWLGHVTAQALHARV
jgi:CrcB protein